VFVRVGRRVVSEFLQLYNLRRVSCPETDGYDERDVYTADLPQGIRRADHADGQGCAGGAEMSSIPGACVRNIGRIVRLPARLRANHSSPDRGRQTDSPIRNEEGSTLVETALTFGILLMTIIGLFQISLAVYAYHSLSELAREATRYAAVRGSDCIGFADCGIDNSGIQQHLRNTLFPAIKPANLTTNTTWYSITLDPSAATPTAIITPCAGVCNAPGNQVRIQVKYDFPLNIPFMPARTLKMSSTSAMIISQ
jgi:Flp pilus assembly protein TadG